MGFPRLGDGSILERRGEGGPQWRIGMSLPRYPEYKDSGVEWLGKCRRIGFSGP
jgi:hypothetical protein